VPTEGLGYATETFSAQEIKNAQGSSQNYYRITDEEENSWKVIIKYGEVGQEAFWSSE